MNAVWPLSRSPVGTRRSWRKREELQRWLNGQQGPGWWEVAPAVAAVLAVLGLPLAGLGWLWSRVGWWAALLAAGALVYAAGTAVRWRRAVLARRRRRARCFSLAEIDASDARGFRAIIGRLLLRDGWTQVRGVRISREVVHLVGNGPDGRQLGVAFERGTGGAQGGGGRAALRPVGGAPQLPTATAPGAARPLFLVVSSGTFTRERVVWAARHGVRLVDRALLQRWAAGEDLEVLLDLGMDQARPDAS
ncbi:hypothetical protein [Streptomyces sennicomposti]|uniref:hypothetical protein n=1 Tax=Streptomyces sennicomposti TaxID=2873384 RepID=UPI001CA74A22|nr:hypothetical protein [Streptomyces sennicomposti]MBY8868691.1 hypothetical protein [Streptomyces sennicomposti]